LEGELEFDYGRRLAPSLVLFHVQLMWQNLFLLQLDVEERDHLPAPDLCYVLQSHNNQSWTPTVMNVSALLALQSTPRGVAAQGGGPAAASGGGVAGIPTRAHRDLGRQVRNPSRDPYFISNTPFTVNVRSWKVATTIALDGSLSQQVMWN
jgi:hypothetical protein